MTWMDRETYGPRRGGAVRAAGTGAGTAAVAAVARAGVPATAEQVVHVAPLQEEKP